MVLISVSMCAYVKNACVPNENNPSYNLTFFLYTSIQFIFFVEKETYV